MSDSEKQRQRARRKRALARKVGHAMDGLVYLQPAEGVTAAQENRVRRVLRECFPPELVNRWAYGDGMTLIHGAPHPSVPRLDAFTRPVERLYAWITKRLRYRNRKAYATARRYGIPRYVVGRGLTLAVINGSTLFTHVTFRAPAAINVIHMEIKTL